MFLLASSFCLLLKPLFSRVSMGKHQIQAEPAVRPSISRTRKSPRTCVRKVKASSEQNNSENSTQPSKSRKRKSVYIEEDPSYSDDEDNEIPENKKKVLNFISKFSFTQHGYRSIYVLDCIRIPLFSSTHPLHGCRFQDTVVLLNSSLNFLKNLLPSRRDG